MAERAVTARGSLSLSPREWTRSKVKHQLDPKYTVLLTTPNHKTLEEERKCVY